MELNKQVVSLELSKKLKELGVKQESLFYWITDFDSHPDEGRWSINWHKYTKFGTDASKEASKISAFTVAELGEMLRDYGRFTEIAGVNWFVTWEETEYQSQDITEANARAKLLIYLLENNILSVKIFDILESSLLSQREEFRKMVEGMKKKDTTVKDLRSGKYIRGDEELRKGYNQALKDILETLKQ